MEVSDLERFENEGGAMAVLRSGQEIYMHDLRFTYYASKDYAEICVWNTRGTHNLIDTWPVEIDTVQDFEMQITFWLNDNGLI